MSRKLEDIFNECYERILQGESVESCLMSYPEHAAELEPLLRTALGFTWRASLLQPRPEFKHWTRVRLQGAQQQAQQQQPAKPGFFSWQQAWAVAVIAVLVVLLAGGSTVAASSDTLPDQPLYPVKLATEQVQVAFAFSESHKAEIHTQLAEKRALEIEVMASQGKTEEATITAERLAKELEQAADAIAMVEPAEAAITPSLVTPEETPTMPTPTPAAPPQDTGKTPEETPPTPPPTPEDTHRVKKSKKWRDSLEGSTSKSLAALEKALEQASEEAKPDWQHAIDRISRRGFHEPQQEPGIQDEDRDRDRDGDRGWDRDESRDSTTPSGSSQNGASSTSVQPDQTQSTPQMPSNSSTDTSIRRHR